MYPLVICYIAIENGEIVDLPIENCDLTHSYVNVYQRVNLHFPMGFPLFFPIFLWFSRGLYRFIYWNS